MFIISGLQQFGLHRNMQNKVELFVRGPGQKMGYNKLLIRISKWAANYNFIIKWDLCCLPQIWRLTCGPTKFMRTQGFLKKKLSQQSTLPASDR